MPILTRRRFLGLSLAPLAIGCQSVPTIFGYRIGADALYDSNIKTIHVPTFQNRAFQTTPYRGFEVDITQALVREIGRVTPFRVTSDCDKADTELNGVVMLIEKHNMNRTQQNMIRDGELQVSVDVVWRDLRDGTILGPAEVAAANGDHRALPSEPPPMFDPNLRLRTDPGRASLSRRASPASAATYRNSARPMRPPRSACRTKSRSRSCR